MTNMISFKNVESMNHLRDFIDDRIDQTIGQLVQHRDLKANVMVEKKGKAHPDYSCEIVIYHPGLRKQIVARKSSPDFYQSVRETCRAVEKSLRRFAQTKSKLRHKNYEVTRQELRQETGQELGQATVEATEGDYYELTKNA